ncbi:PEP/pyruvate-binding domain-containing protein [Nitrospira moscoviensis]|uniref:Phosphoenolpyruvate synthase n=1 Tax=Nitrospira moscoviensis TaxID=42253 RepID=A0A0K2G7D9_NITMO|nr:PEP/pyruvate-binding domain-containing protein [Nitrospira moscoviensis]ALA56850.1 Phosphoenolpyruvate synthase [Nitrospira moscoviensis]
MARPLILPLSHCSDARLAGGKAAGLARLLGAGFPVPPGICLTTEAYRRYVEGQALVEPGLWRSALGLPEAERLALLADSRRRIKELNLAELAGQWEAQLESLHSPPDTTWAVRSSATNEDLGAASFAGLYRTHLGLARDRIEAAVTDLWASLWEDAVVRYLLQRSAAPAAPSMAVVVQPTMEARVSGVCYSIHPVTGRSNRVAVNAVPGLAEPLVEGRVMPDQYVVETSETGRPVSIRTRTIAEKSERLVVTRDGLRCDPLPDAARHQSALSDEELLSLAHTAKDVERALGHPVDLEWLFDERQLWVVQARPITAVRPSSDLTNEDCEWSRANFKETMPDVPSPLGLSFLEYFMEAYIVAKYRRLGCRIPQGVTAVRTLHGRPYLNVTLFHSFIGQLGGDTSLLTEQLGGEPLARPPAVKRLAGVKLARAAVLIFAEMRRVQKDGPRLFAEMEQLASTYRQDRVKSYSLDELARHLDELGRWLDRHEVTFGIAAAVGQCLQAFSSLLPRWLGDDWRMLLNDALRGQGTVISAQQIVRLAEAANIARHEKEIQHGLVQDNWDLAALRRYAPSSTFTAAFDRYLEDYGHRGIAESDIMSPRMSDHPDAILDVIRTQLRGPARNPEDMLDRQRRVRTSALATIRTRLGWRWDRRAVFSWWYRRLCRFFALREANRHHLMHYSTAARNLLLCFGERLVERRIFRSPEDIFFLTVNERTAVLSESGRNWAALIQRRRVDRERWLAIQVPDTIREWEEAAGGSAPAADPDRDGLLRGIPISSGIVTGPVRLLRSPEDWSRIGRGDIIVAPVIDPGMAPLFAVAAGLIAELGGTLSHGAIIAREYGLPTVANVPGAMARLQDGQRAILDAGAGTIRVGEPPDS